MTNDIHPLDRWIDHAAQELDDSISDQYADWFVQKFTDEVFPMLDLPMFPAGGHEADEAIQIADEIWLLVWNRVVSARLQKNSLGDDTLAEMKSRLQIARQLDE